MSAPDHPVRAGLQAELGRAPMLLSGGLGTELQRRGHSTSLPLWATQVLLDAPVAVRELHADYVRAGARLVTANTFRADRLTLAQAGLAPDTRTMNKLALLLARQGVRIADPDAPVFVAGSIGPVRDCYAPQEVPDDQTLKIEHGVRVGHLVAAGATLALVETMNTIREAVAALGACRAGNLPAMVSFVCGPDARLLSGEPIADAVGAVEPLDPMAILVNCCAPPVATQALGVLLARTDLPTGVYANGRGRPDDEQGWRFRGGTRKRRYVREASRWLDMGARLVGGCCGTGPATVRALHGLLRRRGRKA